MAKPASQGSYKPVKFKNTTSSVKRGGRQVAGGTSNGKGLNKVYAKDVSALNALPSNYAGVRAGTKSAFPLPKKKVSGEKDQSTPSQLAKSSPGGKGGGVSAGTGGGGKGAGMPGGLGLSGRPSVLRAPRTSGIRLSGGVSPGMGMRRSPAVAGPRLSSPMVGGGKKLKIKVKAKSG